MMYHMLKIIFIGRVCPVTLEAVQTKEICSIFFSHLRPVNFFNNLTPNLVALAEKKTLKKTTSIEFTPNICKNAIAVLCLKELELYPEVYQPQLLQVNIYDVTRAP